MNVTKTTVREFRFSHDEAIEALGVAVGDNEESQVSSNALYVFVAVKETS